MVGSKKKRQEDPKDTRDPKDLIARKEYKKAIEIYRERLKQQPLDSNLRLALADALLANSQIAEALREYKELGARYTEERRVLDAVSIYKKMLKIRPDMKEIEQLLSGLSNKQEKDVATDPGEPEVYEVIGPESEETEERPPSLFKDLSNDEFKQIVGRLTLRHFEKDTVIVKEGEPGNSLFVIVRGEVRVLTKDKRQKEIVLAKLGEGEFFGEGALLTGRPRTATIITNAASDLLELTRKEYESIIAKHPHIKQVMEDFNHQRAMRTVEVIKKSYREGA
jgi:cAMP-dependent protein kinase regulator